MLIIRRVTDLGILIMLIAALTACSATLGPVFKPISDFPNDKCVIYVYQTMHKYGSEFNNEFSIKYNGKHLFNLVKGGYFPIIADTGKVVITAEVNFKLFVTGILDQAIAGTSEFVMRAKPGKVYYVECLAIEMGGRKLSMGVVPESYGSIRIKLCVLLPKANEK